MLTPVVALTPLCLSIDLVAYHEPGMHAQGVHALFEEQLRFHRGRRSARRFEVIIIVVVHGISRIDMINRIQIHTGAQAT